MMDEYLRFRAGFAQAMDPRFYTIQYLDHLYLAGRAKLFSSTNAAILAEIKIYPTDAKAVHGLYATGKIKEITETLIPAAEEWGRANGCEHAFIDSRDAWQRLLKPSGFDTYKVALIKEL
ncbi:MAG: hypothetical protein JWN69_2527 [Alphaproteobacteria bacterium]|nr:hypothetical protein [Alphaproteobacteria bacterium]